MLQGHVFVKKSIRLGMIGGGDGSVGYMHRSGALRDQSFDLVAAAFDINPEKGIEFGLKQGLKRERLYADYKTMLLEESKKEDGIQAVSIVTPNGTHYTIAKAALEAGLHVICEKPLCFKDAEAQELVELAKSKNKIFGVTYGYAGYQMIQQAREMVKRGDLGEIRLIHTEFAHGGNSVDVEKNRPNQKWRVDPNVAGPTFVLGDLGTHPLYLIEAICPDLKINKLMCQRQSFIKSRYPLEDNAYVIMQYDNGAIGHMWCSAINIGSNHGLKFRIVGEKASISWWQEQPTTLTYEVLGEPVRLLERGKDYLYPEALHDDRCGGGHMEGFFEAWANMYYRFALAIEAKDNNDQEFLKDFWYPDVQAGQEGVHWVNKCVESSENGGAWIEY